eukprot:UN25197
MSCALKDDKSVFCWGVNGRGQIDDTPSDKKFIQISTAYTTICGIETTGEIHCWGDDSLGIISDIPDGHFTEIGVSYNHGSCAITTSKTVECWGWGKRPQYMDNYGQFEPPTDHR